MSSLPSSLRFTTTMDELLERSELLDSLNCVVPQFFEIGHVDFELITHGFGDIRFHPQVTLGAGDKIELVFVYSVEDSTIFQNRYKTPSPPKMAHTVQNKRLSVRSFILLLLV